MTSRCPVSVWRIWLAGLMVWEALASGVTLESNSIPFRPWGHRYYSPPSGRVPARRVARAGRPPFQEGPRGNGRSTNMPERKNLKPIPKFESEDEEREFWATHDSVDHVVWSQAKRGSFPNLKPSTRTISLRLPESLIENLKILANKRDVPYQSLLKIFLAERVEQELGHRR